MISKIFDENAEKQDHSEVKHPKLDLHKHLIPKDLLSCGDIDNKFPVQLHDSNHTVVYMTNPHPTQQQIDDLKERYRKAGTMQNKLYGTESNGNVESNKRHFKTTNLTTSPVSTKPT